MSSFAFRVKIQCYYGGVKYVNNIFLTAWNRIDYNRLTNSYNRRITNTGNSRQDSVGGLVRISDLQTY